MPHSVETTVSSSAPPEVVFEHLAVAEAWAKWARFPQARQERAGDDSPRGLGSIRRIWPAREQTVAYDPSRHYAYILLAGGPIKDYRSDVRLEPADAGTTIHWGATFQPRIPGTGALLKPVVAGMIRYLARGLAAHTGRCPASCPAHK